MACRQLVEEEEEEPPKQTNCPGKRGTTHKKEEGSSWLFSLRPCRSSLDRKKKSGKQPDREKKGKLGTNKANADR